MSSSYEKIKNEELKSIVSEFSRKDAFFEIYVEATVQRMLRYEDSKVEEMVSGSDSGAGIRIIKGGRTSYGSTNDASIKGLKKLIKEMAFKEAGETKIIENEKMPACNTENKTRDYLDGYSQPAAEETIQLVIKADRAARSVALKR